MMKRYFLLYKEFFKNSLSMELNWRFNFIIQSLMNLSFMGMYFFTSFFIFNYIDRIGPWNQSEFLFFLSFVFLVDQIHYLFFALNFWEFSDDIRLGNLDFHLLKPFHSLFIVFFRHSAMSCVFTIFINATLLIYFGIKAHVIGFVWFSLPFCIFISVFFLLGLEIIISLFNFFTVEGMGINQIRLQVQHLSRWPDFIYTKGRKWLFPFLIVNSIPVRWILDIGYWNGLLIMCGGLIVLWILIYFLWSKALMFYESASS